MVGTRGDELDELFAAAPVGQAEPVLHRRGRIVAFNRITLENTVIVDGQIFTDLAVLGVADAAALTPGAEVGLWCVQNSWAIVGRWVKPNTADAIDAITQVSQRMYFASTPGSQSTTSATFTDLSTVGPVVADVHVGPAGRVLVMAACTLNYGATNGTVGGEMSFEVAGATALSPQEGWGPLSHLQATGVSVTTTVIDGKTRITELNGLNPGLHTFTAKYRDTSGAAAGCNFGDRTLLVFSL